MPTIRNQADFFGSVLEKEIVRLNQTSFENEIIRLKSELKAAQKLANDRVQTIARQEAEIARLVSEVNSMARAARTRRQSQSAPFSKEIWRRLLQLCHPDKHDGSEASNTATQWLNANRPA